MNRHPVNFYVRHDQLVVGLHAWLRDLFSEKHRDDTIRLLIESQDRPLLEQATARRTAARRQDAQLRLTRLQDAIEAGADLGALIDRLNAAQAEIVELDAQIAAARWSAVPSPDGIDADLLGEYLGSFERRGSRRIHERRAGRIGRLLPRNRTIGALRPRLSQR